MSGRTALIAGASGLVGSYCLPALLRHYEHVVALGRRRVALAHPRLEQQIVDFQHLRSITFRADDVFSALGGVMRGGAGWDEFRRVESDYPRMLAERALQNGAQQFVFVSTVDAYITPAYVRYTRMRRQLEREVTRLPFRAVHVLRPGLLVGKRQQSRPGEEFTAAMMRWIQWALVGSLTKYHPIAGSDVGNAMVGAALRAEPGVHIYHYREILRLVAEGDNPH